MNDLDPTEDESLSKTFANIFPENQKSVNTKICYFLRVICNSYINLNQYLFTFPQTFD